MKTMMITGLASVLMSLSALAQQNLLSIQQGMLSLEPPGHSIFLSLEPPGHAVGIPQNDKLFPIEARRCLFGFTPLDIGMPPSAMVEWTPNSGTMLGNERLQSRVDDNSSSASASSFTRLWSHGDGNLTEITQETTITRNGKTYRHSSQRWLRNAAPSFSSPEWHYFYYCR